MPKASCESRRPSAGTVFGLLALIVSITGVASASIPGSTGTIEGCYSTASAKPPYPLTIVDNPSDCAAPAVLLPFNQAGAPGAPGPAGHLDASVAAKLQGQLASVKSQLQTMVGALAADQRQEQSLASVAQRFAAAHVPDFQSISGRLRKLVGHKSAQDLFASVARVPPVRGVRWVHGSAPRLLAQFDGASELSELTSLRLQMAMDRRSKFITVLSNILKKIEETENTTVTQNNK